MAPKAEATSTATATTTSTAGSGLAAKVGKIEDKVDALIEALKGGPPKSADPSGANSVAEQVKEELARRDEATKAAERDRDLGNVKETVAKLTEKIPDPPVRRVEKFMGWRNG